MQLLFERAELNRQIESIRGKKPLDRARRLQPFEFAKKNATEKPELEIERQK
jgi:hypothetical protein